MRAQLEFTNKMRHPDKNGTGKARITVYQELVRGTLDEVLENAFPITHQLLDESHWQNLLNDFIAHHHAKTPLFLKIPEEFIQFLKIERQSTSDPKFLFELAHFEWVELALDIAPDKTNDSKTNRDIDLLNEAPLISPLAQLLCYQYPVHKINKDFVPENPSDELNHLIAYRNRQDEVKFMEINPITARLVEILYNPYQLTGKQALIQISNEINHPNPGQIIKKGAETLYKLHKEDVILGTIQENS